MTAVRGLRRTWVAVQLSGESGVGMIDTLCAANTTNRQMNESASYLRLSKTQHLQML